MLAEIASILNTLILDHPNESGDDILQSDNDVVVEKSGNDVVVDKSGNELLELDDILGPGDDIL